MKKLLLVAAIGLGAWQWFQGRMSAPGLVIPPPVASAVAGRQVVDHEFLELFAGSVGFGELAKAGHYTVIEEYLDSCGICKNLERGFPAFLKARPDVRIHRVRLPEGGFRLTPRSEAEAESMNDRLTALGGGCMGSPFIQIYGPGGKLLVTDQCGGGSGNHALTALRQWIAAETS